MRLFRRILRRIFGSFVLASVTFVGAPIAFSATILFGLIFLPLPATIPVPNTAAAQVPTVIYDRYGSPIATLATSGEDLPFTAAQVPTILEEAIVADEDKNYFHESGVDLRGLIRALVADIRNQAPVQGGSTITQQYVKLAYTGSERTLTRKIREAILAGQLAREASKQDILYHYMTLIYLGDGLTGVNSAATIYFHTPLNQLNASQAATISGLIPAPSVRAPEEHLAQAEAARELVLKEMYQQHYLSLKDYQAQLALKLARAGTPQAIPGQSTIIYPPPTTKNDLYPDFVDYVIRWLDQNLPASEIDSGLRVQTTLEPSVQKEALATVGATLNGSTLPSTDMALVSVEPSTGFVDSMVAGKDFGQGEDVNLALGGCATPSALHISAAAAQVPASCWDGSMIEGGGNGRQPGSSFKPFTLATAFEQGIQPSTQIPAPGIYTIPKSDGGCVVTPSNPCTIRNDDPNTSGTQNLATAIADSTNTVFAQLAEQVGCPNVATTAKKMGVESAYYAGPPAIYTCASYSLGEIGVSPLDMASAYGVFANHGQRAAPTPILEIVNAQGKVLVDNIHHLPKTTQVIPANVADNVTNLLQGVLQFGTAAGRGIGRPAAGKTGTTSSNTDAWFVGYTPTLSTAVWMGNANSDSVPVGVVNRYCPQGCVTGHYLNGGEATFEGVFGADWPAITWQEFMEQALNGVPVTPFSAPAPIQTPQEAAALAQTTTTTLAPIEPGAAQQPTQIPPGGPYVYQPTAPVAPPPTSATTAPPTTESTTTTSTTSTTLGQ